ncbi:MAG: helix-turn-helix domain-containing protein [Oscillospiraceae bacterium]|nr:helix-turn-helix domain-containing protein [Oscillospiraceae bacterium]
MKEIFANLIEQIREATVRKFGVIDGKGYVLTSDGGEASIRFAEAAVELTESERRSIVRDGYTFAFAEPHVQGDSFEYGVFVEGTDEHAKTVAILAGIALHESKSYDEEKIDKALFLKNLIIDNTLLSETIGRASELRIPLQSRRGVFLIKQMEQKDPLSVEVVRGLFPDKQRDFVFTMNDTDIVLIKEFDESPPEEMEEGEEYELVAKQILEALNVELFVHAVIGIGTSSYHLRELSDKYKEAQVAIDIGKVFADEKLIMRYDNLGIGRIIFQLPQTLCERYLTEVFKKNPIDALEPETLYTINKFFENNLNVSETSRRLFVHRNTLVYRLEKIKKLTGLDLREFDHAIVFKVALMVRRFLDSQQ